MRFQQLTFAALTLAAGLSLCACQNDDVSAKDSSSAGSSASEPSPVSSPSASSPSNSGDSGGSSADKGGSGSGKKSGGRSGGQDASGGTGKCRTDDLRISAMEGAGGGDENNGFVAVGLTNRSSHDCVLSGFAGVDLKTSAGRISAERKGEPATPVTLKVGAEIDFGVSYPLNKTGGSGVRITGMLVTPPGETKSASVAWPGARSLPVSDTPAGAVSVGPIGSAGQGG